MTNPSAPAAIIATRAVHRAMAQTVATHGHVAAQQLYTSAEAFNAEYFGGQLTAIMVEITAPASPRALATHEAKTPEGVDCVIRIAPSVVDAGERLALDVLLHEMIHVWQAETDNREPGYAGHGPKFAAKCNELGRAMGLPEVGVKGRGGVPDCAQWPLNVRPAGYYGEEGRAPKAVARATRVKAPRAPRAPRAPKAPAPTALETIAGLLPALTEAERDMLRGMLDLA
jgi:hypothetical protein